MPILKDLLIWLDRRIEISSLYVFIILVELLLGLVLLILLKVLIVSLTSFVVVGDIKMFLRLIFK